jgi:transforming growth factor-beta-induced protein
VLGGFVHKIDGVLIPASLPLKTIAELAVGSKLNTLVTALSALDLVNTFDLPQKNAWTVFAPTDAAFAKIQSTVEKALNDKALLQKILLAHVVDSAVFSKDLPAEITTLGGEKIKTSTLKINTKDVGAINGVVHLLDEVIIPPSLQTAAPTTAAPTTAVPTTAAPSKKTSDSAVLSAALTIAATLAGALVF